MLARTPAPPPKLPHRRNREKRSKLATRTAPAPLKPDDGKAGALPPGKRDWLQFRGNPEQTGVAATQLPEKLDILWTFPIQDSFENAVAVADGVVYAGAMDEYLYAVDLATGKQKWKYKAGPFKSAPAVRGGFVYAGDLDGNFHCIDAARGSKRWAFETGTEIGGINFHGTDILFASHDENLYCLTKDGQGALEVQDRGPDLRRTRPSPTARLFSSAATARCTSSTRQRAAEERSVDLRGQTGASTEYWATISMSAPCATR